ncbi:MAG: AAA family ATPase [Lachnospiraceae bacterium]|nr:AAA family ATPase [Lachnospiraceae bacterium]
MLYLSQFEFPDADREFDFMLQQKRTCYDTYYPFKILSEHQLRYLNFEPVTILYGGNGSGKTTALNVMAEKLELQRDALYNRSAFFEDYTKLCEYVSEREIPKESRIITSDDVFDFMLNLRSLNEGIDRTREELFQEYRELIDPTKPRFQLHSLEDYDQLKKVTAARRKTQSRFVRDSLGSNVRERSNGESALMYFTNKIQENGLYLLDEPENSLSPERQMELVKFLEDTVRFFGCQFVIATHSPFFLAMRDAKIYDLSGEKACVKRWTELANVRAYYEFFKKHESAFEED